MLRDQGLGKYCDPEFVRAASREMQEAMDMTPEEFDEAAHRLLQAEQVTGCITAYEGGRDGRGEQLDGRPAVLSQNGLVDSGLVHKNL